MLRKELKGQMFGKWKVLDFDVEKRKWKCECQCELKTIKYHLSNTLTSGMTHECQEGIKFKVDSNFFNVIDTQEKAYILGLLTADGCNYEKDGSVKIDLVEDDVHILNSIKDALKTKKRTPKGPMRQARSTLKSPMLRPRHTPSRSNTLNMSP